MKIYTYDKIADWIYQNIQKGSFISIQGKITNKGVEIKNIVG